MRWLQLYRRVRLFNDCPWYDFKPFDSESQVLELCGNWEYSFIVITSNSSLTWNGNTYLGHIYGSNRIVQSFNDFLKLETVFLCVNKLLILNWIIRIT